MNVCWRVVGQGCDNGGGRSEKREARSEKREAKSEVLKAFKAEKMQRQTQRSPRARRLAARTRVAEGARQQSRIPTRPGSRIRRGPRARLSAPPADCCAPQLRTARGSAAPTRRLPRCGGRAWQRESRATRPGEHLWLHFRRPAQFDPGSSAPSPSRPRTTPSAEREELCRFRRYACCGCAGVRGRELGRGRGCFGGAVSGNFDFREFWVLNLGCNGCVL